MLRKFKFPIIVLAVVLANQVAGYVVHAAMPGALQPAGSTRYAAVGSVTPALYGGTSFANLPGLSTSITIPAGKKGDVFVLFCGEASSAVGTRMRVRALIAGAASAPVYLRDEPGTANYISHCANFFRLGVGAGTKNVRMQWEAVGTGLQGMDQRSMIVIVNIR